MINKKIAAVIAASSMICPLFMSDLNHSIGFSEELTVYNINFYDFNGDLMQTLEVEEGGAIDYSLIDTSNLNTPISEYIQRRFSAWSIMPETAVKDEDIYALYQEATLNVNSKPERLEYFSGKGSISLDGLDVSITVKTQLPEKIDGEYAVELDILNITPDCTSEPSSLENAFADGDTAEILVYPPFTSDEYYRPLFSYKISLFEGLGDIDGDESVNAVDATNALMDYSYFSMSQEHILDEHQLKCADIDRNGVIDPSDATKILQFYSRKSMDENFDWETFFQE